MILVVEPMRSLRGSLASTLRRDGHEVVELADGDELLAELTSRVALVGARPESMVIVANPHGGSVSKVLQLLESARWATPVVLVGDPPRDLEEVRTAVSEATRTGAMPRERGH